MGKIVIGTPYLAPGITIERFGKRDWVIPYSLDEQAGFEVRCPEETFTPQCGEDAVRKQAQLQTSLKGKEIIL